MTSPPLPTRARRALAARRSAPVPADARACVARRPASLVGAEDITLLPAGSEWVSLALSCIGVYDVPDHVPEDVRIP